MCESSRTAPLSPLPPPFPPPSFSCLSVHVVRNSSCDSVPWVISAAWLRLTTDAVLLLTELGGSNNGCHGNTRLARRCPHLSRSCRYFVYLFIIFCLFFFFCFKFSVLLSWLKEAFSFARPAAISAKSDMTTWCRFPSFTAGLKAKLCRPSSRPPIGSNPFIYSSIGAGSDWNCTLCLLLPFQFFFLFFFHFGFKFSPQPKKFSTEKSNREKRQKKLEK